MMMQKKKWVQVSIPSMPVDIPSIDVVSGFMSSKFDDVDESR